MGDVCLRWDQQKDSLSRGMYALLLAGECVDLTLACQGEFIRAHKSVLSVCSEYFKDIFSSTPCKHPVIVLQGADVNHVKSLLQFMYCGETKVPKNELTAFLKTAETLQITGLESFVEKLTNVNKKKEDETKISGNGQIELEVPDKNVDIKIKTEPVDDIEIDLNDIKNEAANDDDDDDDDSEDNPMTIVENDTPAILNCISLAVDQSNDIHSEADAIDLLPSTHFLAASPGISPLVINSENELICSSPEPSTSSYSRDTKVRDILQQWGFSKAIKNFEEEEIDLEAFMQLTHKDIKNLFPNVKQRRKFQSFYQGYVENNGQEMIEDSDNEGESSTKRPRRTKDIVNIEKANHLRARAKELVQIAKLCQQNFQFSIKPSESVESAGSRPLTVEEVCEKYSLCDVDLQFTQEQRQKLTTFNLFQQFVRPLIMSENPMVKMPRLFMLVGAKWRQFCANNPYIQRM